MGSISVSEQLDKEVNRMGKMNKLWNWLGLETEEVKEVHRPAGGLDETRVVFPT